MSVKRTFIMAAAALAVVAGAGAAGTLTANGATPRHQLWGSYRPFVLS
jgi:hypothetical protein